MCFLYGELASTFCLPAVAVHFNYHEHSRLGLAPGPFSSFYANFSPSAPSPVNFPFTVPTSHLQLSLIKKKKKKKIFPNMTVRTKLLIIAGKISSGREL